MGSPMVLRWFSLRFAGENYREMFGNPLWEDNLPCQAAQAALAEDLVLKLWVEKFWAS